MITKKVLVTGALKFISLKTSERLHEKELVVLYILNDYYDASLKVWCLILLLFCNSFEFYEIGLKEKGASIEIFDSNSCDAIVNFAI